MNEQTALLRGAILKLFLGTTLQWVPKVPSSTWYCYATGNCGPATDKTWKDGAKKQMGRDDGYP